MNPSGVEPIRKSIVVNTGVARAFALFINQFDAIKPREHNLLSVPIAETVFEPRARVVISWDIGPTWQLEADPAKTSEVEVRFIAESDDRTRVELEHRHLD